MQDNLIMVCACAKEGRHITMTVVSVGDNLFEVRINGAIVQEWKGLVTAQAKAWSYWATNVLEIR